MRSLFLLFSLFLCGVSIQAQSDSIAVSQMKELGVYYLQNDSLVQIEPIMSENTSSRGNLFSVKASVQYLGEKSEHLLSNSPTFYVYIPSEFKNRLYAKQFRLIALKVKGGFREVDVVSVTASRGKAGVDSRPMNVTKLNDNCFKLSFDGVIKPGQYGIYYNYGGSVPLKLYDFEVKE